MAKHDELRVHGAPKDMLYTEPVGYDLNQKPAQVFEPNRDPFT